MSAWALCAEQMTERLVDGRWPHGQLIPHLGGLRGDLGMTTPPINRALQELVERRLLTAVDRTLFRLRPVESNGTVTELRVAQ